MNRGKRTIAVDLTHDHGRALLMQLVRSADVFVQNFRPGVAERLGIDEPQMRAVNERLVYVSISGFGETGPYVDQKSYDYVIQALSGMATLQADPTTGEPALIRNALVDKVTAYVAAHAITAALLERERSAEGLGQHVRLSMLDTALAFFWPDGMMQHTLLGDGVTEGAHLADNYMVRATKDGQHREHGDLGSAVPLALPSPRHGTLARRSALRHDGRAGEEHGRALAADRGGVLPLHRRRSSSTACTPRTFPRGDDPCRRCPS